MKPIIGVTPATELGENKIHLDHSYYKAIQEAGGIPFIFPLFDQVDADEILQHVNGILLTGGLDVDAKYFGEMTHPKSGHIIPERDEMEITIVKEAVKKQIPILGICRGIQVMNVALQGSIYQDIYAQNPDKFILKHKQEAPRWYGAHQVSIMKNSRLYSIFNKETIMVNSFHHQAVRNVSKELVVTAISPDGIIEAIEYPEHPFFIGVQWHPESMFGKNEEQLDLFKKLVNAAQLYFIAQRIN